MKRSLPKTLHTKCVKHYQTNDFNLCEIAYPPTLVQPLHTHKYASFSFVLNGNYVESVNRRTHSRRASTVVFHPPEESHAVVFENDVRILSVEFSFERLAKIRQHSVIFDEAASCRSDQTNNLGMRIYREFCRMDAFSTLALEGLILELLAEVSRCRIGAGEKNVPRWLEQTRDYLRENFTETVSLEEIAGNANVHPVHLSRVFREKFGCTVGEYVRRLRVEFASSQIVSTESSLCEIAHAAGFADQSHFNKTFKKAYGLTPAEYRKLKS